MAQLPAQAHQLIPFGGGQALLARQGLALINGSLADPVGDGLGGDAELTRKLCWRAASSHKLDHLLPEFRRVRRSYF